MMLLCAALLGALVWSDEFNGPLDTNVWQRIGEGRSDWDRHMSTRPDLVEMRDGCLVLVGTKNCDTNADPRPYLTGGVWNMKGPAQTMMTYGRVEIRARFENATGAWPAFWMLPRDKDAQGRGWPWTGEIDIIERLNGDPFVYQTAHSGWTYHKGHGDAPKQGGKAPIRQGEFNVYGLERTPTALIWYVNGEETFRYEKTDCGDVDQWPFTTPFYFLLDMQLGGKWVGEVDMKTLPVRTWIDWIRVYDCACACRSEKEPNISVFAKFVRMIAKERGISLAEAADMLYAIGVRGYDCGPDEPDLDELAKTKLKPINFYYFPDWFGREAPDDDRTKPAECLAKAKRYGIPRIMVVPPGFTDGKDNPAEFEKILTHMKGFVAVAKKQGITITIEDFGGTSNPCSYAKYLKRFLDEIPDIRFALDTGNLHYAGRGDDILEMMAYAKGRIGHVHLKDQPAGKNREYETLGLGTVPNEKIVKTVNAAGYDGWYTLEEPVGDTYTDTVRQVAVLKSWLSGK